MKLKIFVVLTLLCQIAILGRQPQVRAGSQEATMFDQIVAEANPDTKLTLIGSFEQQFPQSKILSRVYLLAVDVYRSKENRIKLTEFAEKALAADNTNVTAMMVLARNHAIDAKNLDRAIELSQRAIDRMAVLRKEQPPTGYTPAQWEDYLKTTEESAKQILGYARAIKARESVSLAKPEDGGR
jgi:hypothetical protein